MNFIKNAMFSFKHVLNATLYNIKIYIPVGILCIIRDISRGCATGLDFFRTAAPKRHVSRSTLRDRLARGIVYTLCKMPTSPSARVYTYNAERDEMYT